MGSVKVLTTTGDNDIQLETEQYYRHYMYCDECGSFEIESWKEPQNHEQIQKVLNRIERISTILIQICLYGVAFAVIILLVVLITTGHFAFDALFLVWLAIFLVPVGILFTVSLFLQEKIINKGMQCRNCGEKFANGSAYFTDLDSNPRTFGKEDIPEPRAKNYWING